MRAVIVCPLQTEVLELYSPNRGLFKRLGSLILLTSSVSEQSQVAPVCVASHTASAQPTQVCTDTPGSCLLRKYMSDASVPSGGRGPWPLCCQGLDPL